ncbi:cyclopropane-fatty-acyl-phospholipid synthase [Trifolium repens]|nr:cyclopropane-fatty-acyl-phospholipid synthase [Trifolium repens]
MRQRLLEEGGTMFTFEGTGKNCSPKSVLRVHNPQFYWKAVFLNVVSGLTLTETLGDLAIAAAIYSRLCLRVWRGREGKERLKRKKQVEGVEKFGREEV